MLVAGSKGEGQRKYDGTRLRTRDGGPTQCSLFMEVENNGHMAGLVEHDNGGDARWRCHRALWREDTTVSCGSARWWRTDGQGSRVR